MRHYRKILSLVLIMTVFSFMQAPYTQAAGGDVIFNDAFTGVNGTELSTHSPDTGTSWTQIRNNEGDDDIDINSNLLSPSASDTSGGVAYTADVTYATSSYAIKMNLTAIVAGGQDKMTTPILRATGDPLDSGYTIDDWSDSSGDNPDLMRITGTGTCSQIGLTFENGQSWPEGPIIDDGDDLLLQVLVDEIVACDLTSNICFLFYSDTNITATGKAAFASGHRPCDTGGDLNTGTDVDDFQVLEIGEHQQGWKSPQTEGETDTGWSDPGNVALSDGADASCANEGGCVHDFGDFGFDDSVVGTVRGVMVKAEFGMSTGDWGIIAMKVSNDNGATYSTVEYEGYIDSTTDRYMAFGHANELWGLTWSTAGDISDTDLRVLLTFQDGQDTSADAFVDHLQVKIIYDGISESYQTGEWTSASWDAGAISSVDSSQIEWSTTTPSDTAVVFKTAVNTSATVAPDDGDFSVVTNGGTISGATGNLTGKYVWVRIELTGSGDGLDTPIVHWYWLAINQAAGGGGGPDVKQDIFWF